VGSTEAAQLEAEQAHLADARDGLRRMREKADSLVAAGGNAVSTAYLAASLFRRRMSLVDDPSTPLFFGRTDIDSPDVGLEHFYIGRRHVADERGDPMVVDWRADISLGFYRASLAAPMGVVLRRRFGFDGGRLTAYEDETFGGHGPGVQVGVGAAAPTSRILTEEIERPRVGPMRDIVATICSRRSAFRAAPAPARPRSDSIARLSCCTPTGRACEPAAFSWWVRTPRSCTTSSRCCRLSARSR
jgi:hypothetical protein